MLNRHRTNNNPSVDGEKMELRYDDTPMRNSNQGKAIRLLEKWNNFTIRKEIHWRLVIYSLMAWCLLINYYERVVVKRALNICQWSKWENWPKEVQSHKVALFADPQIMDNYSYPGRPNFINYITRVLVDHYHSRNWKYVQQYLNPDSNFFLGDLFDGGRNWEDEMWIEEFERFHEIFPRKPGKKTVFSLPGNHDIGFGDTVVEKSFQRFRTFFGETSSSHDVGNHTFVLLDTIAMSDLTNENVSSVPREFLKEYSNLEHPYPRILLTHVPLWRNSKEQTCGKLRESKKPFPIMKGLQYQTVIDQSISQNILTTLKPIHIFSGDDHDYCHINHPFTNDGHMDQVSEITVKSCAMNMGISRPAIQLISLFNDGASKDTMRTEICYMPDPFKPIWMYIIIAIINLCIAVAVISKKANHKFDDPLPMPLGVDNYQFKSKKEISKFITGKNIVLSKVNMINIVKHISVVLLGIWFIFRYYYI